MALDPALFPLCNALDIRKGDRVLYRTSGKFRPSVEGEGTIALIWLGIEEVVNIEADDGTRLSLYPALGDHIESPHGGASTERSLGGASPQPLLPE